MDAQKLRILSTRTSTLEPREDSHTADQQTTNPATSRGQKKIVVVRVGNLGSERRRPVCINLFLLVDER